MSGINKQAVLGEVKVTRLGLAGDQQGDVKHHGGPEKSIHHYPFDHYAVWENDHPELGWRLRQPGAFGENISTLGITEHDVCVGDVFHLGSAVVQISQGRQPCWKLNARFDEPRMARWVQRSGRSGWYYRVLAEGKVSCGDTLERIECLHADWSISRVLHVLFVDTPDPFSLGALSEMAVLAESWRELAAKRMKRTEAEVRWTPDLGPVG